MSRLVVAVLACSLQVILAQSLPVSSTQAIPLQLESGKSIQFNTYGIIPYHTNYFLPITYNDTFTPDRRRLESKFQLSAQKELSYDIFGFDESISIAYTQITWWGSYKSGIPIRETNYLPEIFLTIPITQAGALLKSKVGLLHESNGYLGWSRLYATLIFQFGDLLVAPRIWHPLRKYYYHGRASLETGELDDDDTVYDVDDVIGYGDVTLIYTPRSGHIFRGTFRNNLKGSRHNRGALELEWLFPIRTQNNSFFGYIQYFHGHGESLGDLNRRSSRGGIGIALSL